MEPSHLGTKRGRWLRLVVGYALALAALIFTISRVGITWSSVVDQVSDVSLVTLMAAVLLFFLHGFLNALAYGFLLASTGGNVTVVTGAVAWGGSVLAKYIPGGVWHVIGRGAILHGQGVAPATVLLSSALEQVVSLLACMFIVAATFHFAANPGWQVPEWIPLVASLSCSGLGVLVVIRLGVIRRPSFFFIASFGYVAAMVPFALAYLIVVDPASNGRFLFDLFVGTVSGMLVIVAPSGVGIRESLVAVSQADAMSSGRVLGTMLLARVLILASEVLLTALAAVPGGMGWIRGRGKAAGQSGQ